MNADRLLDRLEAVKRTGSGRWIARCPAHDDHSPSLGIAEKDDGRVLVRCWAGCATPDVMHAVGLSMSDLFPDGPLYHYARGLQRRSEQRAYCEAMVEIAASDLRSGRRLGPADVAALKKARDWIVRNPEAQP